jgi:hypothetical protein
MQAAYHECEIYTLENYETIFAMVGKFEMGLQFLSSLGLSAQPRMQLLKTSAYYLYDNYSFGTETVDADADSNPGKSPG